MVATQSVKGTPARRAGGVRGFLSRVSGRICWRSRVVCFGDGVLVHHLVQPPSVNTVLLGDLLKLFERGTLGGGSGSKEPAEQCLRGYLEFRLELCQLGRMVVALRHLLLLSVF